MDRADVVLARGVPPSDLPLVRQRRKELCWTLAALWRDPPAEDAATVKGWIDARPGRRAR